MRPPSANPLRLAAIVVTVALAAHLGSLAGGFTTVDDHALVVENPAIKGVGLWSLFHLFTGVGGGTYLPIRALSYAVDYRVWRLDPFGYHLTNVALHALAALALLWGVACVTGTARLGLLVALLFAVHPIHVEGVAWVSGRKEMLCTLFSLCACLCYLACDFGFWSAAGGLDFGLGRVRGMDEEACVEGGGPNLFDTPPRRVSSSKSAAMGFYLGAWAFMGLACASKGVAVVLPAVFVLFDFCRIPAIRYRAVGRDRTVVQSKIQSACGGPKSNIPRPVPFRLIAFHLPFWLLAGAFIVIHALAGRSSGAIVEPRGGGMAMNALLAVGNLATYGRLILFPVHLRPKYPSADPAALTTPHLLGAAAIAVALAALCVWSFARRDRRVIAFCLGWFLLNWLPVSSLVFPIGTAVAERYLQVPILGGYFLAAGALAVALRERRGSDHSAILERSLSAVRRTQSPAPQQANPPQADCTPRRGAMAASRSAVPRRLLALALAVLVAYCALSAQRGLRWQTGRSLWAEAVPISPDLADNYVGMGNAYMQAGQLDRAVRAFQAALGREPNSPVALHNLGLAHHRMGQLDEALVFYQRANQFSRPAEQDFSNIGIIYYEQGRYAEALAEYDKAIRARPDFAPAYHNLANALVRLDELDHAILAYGRAIQLDPDFGDAYLALGKACFTQGNLAVAIPAFQMAARLGPHSSEAHACLGVLLQTLGQPAAAKDQLRQSLALDPNVWQAHYLDGLIHEAEGALDRAADAYARSLSLNPHAEAVRERLEAIQGRPRQDGEKVPANSGRQRIEQP